MVKPLVGLIFIVAFLIVKPTMVDFLKHYFGFEPKFKSELYAGVTLGAYCKEKGLANGFYMINPFENLDKQFEIFCYNKRDFIILPINNTYNNYIFTDKCTGNKCYDDYDFSANKRANFHAIEINANTMQVVANNSSIESVNGGGNNFSIMPNGFSNINLIGTPFAIDWDNSSVSGCVIQKRGHFDQAVKIKANPTQGESVCNITKMKLKLLNEYKFSHDNGTEIVANSCRRLADKLPKTMVASKELQDYRFRWIAPISQTRSEKTYDKTKASERPFVASCLVFDVQGDSSSEKFDAWTVLLALDGKTTANKNDLNQKLDSCSSFGLYPFVANSETTFERARWYLSSIKPNWESYVVNMNERIESVDGKGKGYYLPSEGSAKLWPYGSFGVYFPKAGDKDINGVSKKWGSGVSTTVGFATVGWVAGSPMHNIEDITNDYPTYVYGGKNIYVGSPYSLSDTKSIAKTYTYADTLGAKGFRSILADLQSNSDDVEPMSEWFISRTGAGRNTLHPTNYYEPNGNYVANCWFNYLFDNDGRVRHMDDYNCGYKYNDYLCMASNNYTSIEIKKLQDGVFDAVNSDISLVGVPSVANRVIKTQVVNEPFALKLYISDVSKTSFISDATKDITAGVYLFNTATNTEVMKLGEFSSKNGTMSLTDIKVPRAVANAQVKFKYCADYTKKWSECWSSADVGKVTAKGGVSNGSTDLFAIRPDRFELTVDKAQKTGDSFRSEERRVGKEC